MAPQPCRREPSWLDRFARRAVLGRLERIAAGSLWLRDGGDEWTFGGTGGSAEPAATLAIHDPRAYGAMAFGGSIGAAEAYMQGYWTCSDLTSALRVLLRNRAVLDGFESGAARLTAPLRALCISSIATPVAAAAATSRRTTILATTSSRCGSTNR